MPELPNPAPSVCVQIPTRGRVGKLAACVRSLAQQSLDPGQYEVLIGLDGPDDEAARAAREAWGDRPAQHLRVVDFPCAGHLPIRRGLVGMTRASVLVFMNDDVVAEPGFLAGHLAAHREAEELGAWPNGVMVAGETPWAVPDEDMVFDRLVRETSLIFFYDAMNARRDERDRDWGFRHFWTLNASAPRQAVLRAGGFTGVPQTYGHEDIELAFRMHHMLGMPVLYRPEARATHDHRYRPSEVMRREFNLGAASWHFAVANPDFGRTLFGRDITDPAELEYSRGFVERERGTAQRLAADLEALGSMRGEGIPSELLPILSRQFLLLKRHLWRQGLLSAAELEAAPERAAAG